MREQMQLIKAALTEGGFTCQKQKPHFHNIIRLRQV